MATNEAEPDERGRRRHPGPAIGPCSDKFGYIFISIAVFLISFLHPGVARSFHSGGVGDCQGCHSLHSAKSGAAASAEEGSGAEAEPGALLAGQDPSSTCLRCHSGEGAVESVLTQNGSARTPGGDFAWLKQAFRWTVDGKTYDSPGESHGHSIVASEYGLASDGRHSTAPGGTYSAASFSCISCHDPHGGISGSASNGAAISMSGSYGDTPPGGTISGNYRLLGGAGYRAAGESVETFSSPAPVAVANRADWRETETRHTDYGSGMSEWCANCHAGMLHVGNGDARSHPAGNDVKLGREVAAGYNAYVRTGDLSGSRATSYLALVPFERGTSDVSQLNPSSTEGPDENANVMCLTCHRAHASAFSAAGRWDFRATLIVQSHPHDRDAYYGRDMAAQFGPYQRSFCNKCHLRD